MIRTIGSGASDDSRLISTGGCKKGCGMMQKFDEEILLSLLGIAIQNCETEPGVLDSKIVTYNADAIKTLVNYGVAEYIKEPYGRVVYARVKQEWMERLANER